MRRVNVVRKQARDTMTKAIVFFVVLIFIMGLLPMFFR